MILETGKAEPFLVGLAVSPLCYVADRTVLPNIWCYPRTFRKEAELEKEGTTLCCRVGYCIQVLINEAIV